MIVTIKAPSRRLAARAEFECIKYGIECDYMEDNHFDIVVHDPAKASIIAASCHGTIVAVVDKILFDPIGA